jgi:hypothetical protein
MKRSLKYLLILVLFNMVNSCGKESNDMFSVSEMESAATMIGTWVSENHADTLYVINNHSFNKPMQDGVEHFFEYSLSKDSITIRYKGPNKIWVMASTHYYKLNCSKLMIDFTNHCYGFANEKETYIRQGE